MTNIYIQAEFYIQNNFNKNSNSSTAGAIATTEDISMSMLRLWGHGADQVAFDYAQTHKLLGDTKSAQHWQIITETVAQMKDFFSYNADSILFKNAC